MHMQRTVFFGLGVVLGLVAVMAAPAWAAAPAGASEAGVGLGGEIILGGVYIQSRPSQLDVGEENKPLSGLDAEADTEYAAAPYLSVELHYTLANLGTTLSIGCESESTGVSMGISQPLGRAGQVRVNAIYGEEEAWKDPYLTGVKRHRTKVDAYGLNLRYEEIFGTGAFFSSTTTVVDVEADEIGEREKKLRRDGHRSSVEAGYSLALNEHAVLTPTLYAESNNTKGEANASDGAGMAIAYGWNRGHWLLEAAAGAGYSEYRKTHPVFDNKRKATHYELSTMLGYAAPFGWTPITLYGLVSYNRVDENISFFDAECWTAGLGLGVEF